MHFIAIFEQTDRLELALSLLEETGIARTDIAVAQLRGEAVRSKDIYLPGQLYLLSPYEVTALLASFASTLGVVYGFTLALGPIFWGLAGGLAGAAVGYTVDSLAVKRVKQESKKFGNAAVVVQCTEDQLKTVETILFGNGAKVVTEITKAGD